MSSLSVKLPLSEEKSESVKTNNVGCPKIPISVVIPVYNRAKILPRAIKSVLEQTYKPFEIIVVDDGSIDSTAEVARSFGSLVRVLQQPNSGVSVARNRGVSEARCEWVAFLDSDDYWSPNHLACMVHAIEATKGQARFYFSDIKLPSSLGGGSHWARAGFKILGKYKFIEDGRNWVLQKRIPMYLQASVVNVNNYLKEGGLWEILRTREDTHFFIRMSINGPVCAVSNQGTIQMDDDSSGQRLTDKTGNIEYLQASIMIWSDLLKRFPKLESSGIKIFRSRLADARFQLAKKYLMKLRPIACARHICAATKSYPSWWLTFIIRKMIRSTNKINI